MRKENFLDTKSLIQAKGSYCSHLNLITIFSITLAIIVTILSTFHYQDNHHHNYTAYAHIAGSNNSNKVQEWINQREGIKIQFIYKPDKPIIDTFTELKFSVQNLTTGDHIKDLLARIVVTNGQRLFKFENISVPDGDFSVKYLFPDDGTHQVITRIDVKDSINLASFNVFVPHQQTPSLLNPFPSSPSSANNNDNNNNNQKIIMAVIIFGLIGGIAVATIIVVKRK
jgi:hypothetical protein